MKCRNSNARYSSQIHRDAPATILRCCAVALLFLLVAVGVTGCTNYEEEVPRLIQELHASEPRRRSQAALKLGRIGAPHAVPATRSLIPLLYDENVGVSSAAAVALRKIGTRKALQALEKAR